MEYLESRAAETAPASAVHEELWLLGQAPLQKYLDFAHEMGLEPSARQRPLLIDEWRAASAYYEQLEISEAGLADKLEWYPLDAALEPLAAEVKASSRYTRTFDSLPTTIAMVELARLVVCQNHVTRSFVDRLKTRLGARPTAESLFRFCLPLEEDHAPVQIREVGTKRFVFSCESTDFRFHEALLLRPDQLADYASFGAVAGAVGLVVGFSSNFLNAVCDEDSQRLLLHNGYHRACALLELGITHAPCVVQTVTCRDELDLVAKPLVANDPGHFFNSPRPALLKDYVDPRIRKLLKIKKVARMIEVNFDVRDYFVQE
ncbi:MAG TPA: hypothetical protein VF861_13520 [Telluria sp.]